MSNVKEYANKYGMLIEQIELSVEREISNLSECERLGNGNSVGAAMCMGALDAYEDILMLIEDLTKEVPFPND